ncbi:MAG: hypothetical protein JNM95_10020 [Chitinophagaceae bacterium]|nr:hypothetical protein [Chitinophagaceae bacterium]
MLSLTAENNCLLSGTYKTNNIHTSTNVHFDEAESHDINGMAPTYFDATIEIII